MPQHASPPRAPLEPRTKATNRPVGRLSGAVRRVAAVLSVVTITITSGFGQRNSRTRGWSGLTSGGTEPLNALLNPIANESLRDRLSRRAGAQPLEFLLCCWNFQGAANSLQRFAQLRYIIDRFVRDYADRPIKLSEDIRRNLLAEWARWSKEERIPTTVRLLALEAAANEINRQVADDPLTPFLLNQRR
ncbi:hypothetical protein [Caenimonas koreensis]|uniref:Uncharacterized protein n=1 Tax=Caenimonas koreensis DSM 17982 TaxID=1121255 RepID=A0A844AWR1_9BURK|nr:hypothetical protein [Caenimonas koreensis]MRD48960.1 hypothetical protein [Caenimonas koreensis DSM 17982]